MSAPAGWHPQPDGRERFWDGTQWTDQYRSPYPSTTSAVPTSHRPAGRTFKPWMGYVAAGLVGLFVGMGIGGASASDDTTTTAAGPSSSGSTSTATVTTRATVTAGPTPTATVTKKVTVTAPPPAPEPAMGDGTWVVGTDIKPGTYRATEPVSSGCYWSITKSGTNGDDIIANDLPGGGRPQVTLKKGQDFSSGDCGDWARVGG